MGYYIRGHMFRRLAFRHLVPERMDDPSLDRLEHHRALVGLRRINRLCFTSHHIAREIARIVERYPSLSEWRVLDLGCGSGDIATDVYDRLSPKIPLHMSGWDISPTAIAIASQFEASGRRATQKRNIEFKQQDAIAYANSLREETPPFDIVYCCLFLHHFNEEQSIEFLQAMRRLAKRAVIVDDLNRSTLGWCLAVLGCKLLSRSPVVHFDGPQSVRAAYIEPEMKQLAEQSGLTPFRITRHWPQRFLFLWENAR